MKKDEFDEKLYELDGEIETFKRFASTFNGRQHELDSILSRKESIKSARRSVHSDMEWDRAQPTLEKNYNDLTRDYVDLRYRTTR